MAVPTLTSNLTSINNWDTLNGSGWGQNAAKWSLESDIVLEGTNSVGLAPFQTGDGGYGYQTAANVDVTANLLLLWVYVQPGFVNTSTNYGVYVRVTDSTTSWTTNYYDWQVGGSDVAWVGRGWHLIALDCNTNPDRSAGTPPVLTAIRRIGVGTNMIATASKSTIVAIDAWYYGSYVEATGVSTGSLSLTYTAATSQISRGSGSFITDGFETGDKIVVSGTTNNNGEYTITGTVNALNITVVETLVDETVTSIVDGYIGFEDIYQKDGPTDDNWWGAVSKNPLGLYELNYNLYIGDQSGSNRTRFRSRGEVAYFADQPAADRDVGGTTNYLNVYVVNDTGFTDFEAGTSSGSGDNRVGFSGSVFSQDNTFFGVDGKFDFSDTVNELEVYGATFLGIGKGVDFSTSTTHRVFNTTFSECGPVNLGAVEARNLTFSGYSGTDGALNWNGSINIKNSSFLANRNDAGTAHAIYHGSTGTFTYDNLKFAGNDYDIENATAGLVTINAANGANPSTYENTGGGTTQILNTKTLRVEVLDSGGAAVEGTQVWIQKDPGGNAAADYGHPGNPFTSAAGNNQGDGDFVVTTGETVPSDLPSSGWIVVHDVSTGEPQNYRYASRSGQTFTFNTKFGPYACTGGGTSTSLQDTVNDLTNLVEGDTVRNETDGSWAIILEIVDANNATTTALQGGTDNTWTSGDNYSAHTLAVNYVSGTDTATVPLMNEETDVSGIATESYNYGTDKDVIVRVRLSSGGGMDYLPYSSKQKLTGTSSYALDLLVSVAEDTIKA
ncbi:hypothetical protein GTO10_02405 [Candidatus Saccharibacteria bacterium]|nr:hypothetical protein [Candidatus Saccharibacteria bacterium]